eukprot:1285147-Prymnesium_polylepis.1
MYWKAIFRTTPVRMSSLQVMPPPSPARARVAAVAALSAALTARAPTALDPGGPKDERGRRASPPRRASALRCGR